MSGIFKGDSIYKSGGGGGGGYKDGGELVDANFIEVENNTVSSYNNENRNTVNFYMDSKAGDIVNSVIELTTQVNATVNVYVVRNGLYYLLNYTVNTVNANEDYVINITGNSYEIEQTNEPLNNDPVLIYNGNVYKCHIIGNQIWTEDIEKYIYWHDMPENIGDGWRVPAIRDFNNLIIYCIDHFSGQLGTVLRSTSGWVANNGTNESGFNSVPNGYCSSNTPDTPTQIGEYARYWTSDLFNEYTAYMFYMYYYNVADFTQGQMYAGDEHYSTKLTMRFVKDL